MPPLQLQFTTLDVFTETRFAGNPLAVVRVPAASSAALTQDRKQRVAREFNLSETVFLHDGDDESATSRRVDIFTIDQELPFAGHPTIGTAVLVRNVLGWRHVDTLVTKAGAIGIAPDGGRILAQIPHDVHVHARTLRDVLNGGGDGGSSSLLSAEAVRAARTGLSDDEATREAELAAPAVSIVRGMTFLLVELPSLEHLARVGVGKRLDFGALSPALLDEGPWHKSFVSRYYYVRGDSQQKDTTTLASWSGHTRMVELDFEDPATGSAACTLASYLTLSGKGGLAAEKGSSKLTFDIVQGEHMGRRSDIAVEVHTTGAGAGAGAGEGGSRGIDKLFLGGTAVPVMEGTISV
ncbi:Glycerol kinase [Purpureocillium lavendulum]|uniref:Glycerol kinase n=1 Tax=Purpureocillium lavendulum TaxID=1247861 RepID=A0AB34FEC3_9HYPO|nr:Glycerol kinase [Purpureocillium lavendulum]